MNTIVVEGFHGMGDTLYMRPAIKKLIERDGSSHQIYVRTPWYQLLRDLPVKILRKESHLRTQDENVRRGDALKVWDEESDLIGSRIYDYVPYGKENPTHSFFKQFGFPQDSTADFYADPFCGMFVNDRIRLNSGESISLCKIQRPVALVKWPTVRKEWKNTSRNPDTSYMRSLVIANPQFFWISVSWLKNKVEWMVEPENFPESVDIDIRGGMDFDCLLRLFKRASLVLTSPAYPVVLGPSMGVPTFVVFGGSIPPEDLLHRDLPRVGYVAPEPFCACWENEHACNKAMDLVKVRSTFDVFLKENGLGTVSL